MLILMLVLTGLSVSMSYNMTKEAVSSGAGGSGSGGGLAPWMAGYGPHGTVYRQPISGTLPTTHLSLSSLLFFIFVPLSLLYYAS